MGLRDRLKRGVKKRVTADPVAQAGLAAERASSKAAATKRRAAQLQARLEALDAGQAPDDGEDDLRTQAERAEEAAKMTAPVEARLDPIDVPHPYGKDRRERDDRDRGRRRERPDRRGVGGGLNFASDRQDRDEDDDAPGLLDFGDEDDDRDDPFEGGLL